MASKPLQYVVVERKITFGKHTGKIMKIAQPSGRQRIPFRRFCDEVARSTSFTRQEVEAVINYATEIAKDFVSNGDMVDFGDLGTLVPSFKSRAVGQEEKFNPNIHIEKPMSPTPIEVLLHPHWCALQASTQEDKEIQPDQLVQGTRTIT